MLEMVNIVFMFSWSSKAIFFCVITVQDTENCSEIERCEVRQPGGESYLILVENLSSIKSEGPLKSEPMLPL
jgi:hypothetical protein